MLEKVVTKSKDVIWVKKEEPILDRRTITNIMFDKWCKEKNRW